MDINLNLLPNLFQFIRTLCVVYIFNLTTLFLSWYNDFLDQVLSFSNGKQFASYLATDDYEQVESQNWERAFTTKMPPWRGNEKQK